MEEEGGVNSEANRTQLIAKGMDIENEDFVNVPNWLPVSFKIEDGEYLDPEQWKILSIDRQLSFRDGLLSRDMLVEDGQGRQTRILSKRVASMADRHLAAIQYQVTPLNYSGNITLRCTLSGDHLNAGVERYKQLEQQHLEPLDQGGDRQCQYLQVRTTQSEIEIGMAGRIRIFLDQTEKEPDLLHITSEGRVESEMELLIRSGQSVTVEKLVAIYTSREAGHGLALKTAREKAEQLEGFQQILLRSAGKWEEIWKAADIRVAGDRFAQKLIIFA